MSGFGFELTLRLKKEPGSTTPPTWPTVLMNSLARYVFRTGESRRGQNFMKAGVTVPSKIPTRTPFGVDTRRLHDSAQIIVTGGGV